MTTDQALTFTASVSSAIGAGPAGMVAFVEDGSVIGVAPVAPSGVATFTASPFLPGLHAVSATYFGDPAHTSSPSNVVTVGVLPTFNFGAPTVTSARMLTSRSVEVSFSRPLLVGTAQDRANYAVIGPGGHALAVESAVYDPADDSVTVTTQQAFNPRRSYELMVNGVRIGRVDDTYGIPLAGNNGRPGTSYVGNITPQGPHSAGAHHASPKLAAHAKAHRKGH